MTVESVTKKRGRLYLVSFDNGEEILLDTDFCHENGIKCGRTTNAEETAAWAEESDRRRAVSRSIYYIEHSDLSEKRLSEKLKHAGFSCHAVNFAVNRMKEIDLINDTRYALRQAQRMSENNVSQREAYRKLTLLGIDRDLAHQVISETPADPISQITEIVAKKYAEKLKTQDGVKKVFAALARKGFDFSDIKSVLREYSEDLKYSEE